MSTQEKVDFYTDKSGDCWLWKGNLSARGYGRLSIAGKTWMAHKLAYQLATEIPLTSTTVLHHKCANKACVRPDHLEPITQSENVGEMLARKTFEKTIRRQEERIAELEAENAMLRSALDEARRPI